MLACEDIAVVVSDINMPGMDGLALLRAVARFDAEIPVILLTAQPTLESAIIAVEYGACHYLTKPFDVDELQQVVKRAANLGRMAKLRSRALAVAGMPVIEDLDPATMDSDFNEMLQGLWMAFQPLVHAGSGDVFGYEALLRTVSAKLPHPPAVLGAAELLSRTEELGRCVRERAARTMLHAPDRGTLFLNLHPQDLLDDDLLDSSTPLALIADRTILKITERRSLSGIHDLAGRLQALRDLGHRIAVDDLGAGYAGLTSLVVLQPDFVKLDMTLVRDVDKGQLRQRLIESVVEVCHDSDIRVVAEGIETPEERDTVVGLGVDLLQGYLLARPGRAFPELA